MHNIIYILRCINIIYILGRNGILLELSKSNFLSSKIILWLKIINFFVGKKIKNFEFGPSLVDVLNQLGPAFVKLGQGLATRPDLIGASLSNELSQLQDRMKPFEFEDIKKTILHETGNLPEKLFLEFEAEPVAAASIAQVHKGVNFKGKSIAIKILRPGIEKAIYKDLQFFYWIAQTLSSFDKSLNKFRLVKAVEVFKKVTEDEMDLRLEAAAANELSENFKDDERFSVPNIDWSLTSRRMLVLDWVEGLKITDREKLISEGHDIKTLTSSAAEAFFLQIFRDGFFHADMHPGNLFVTKEGKLMPVDFGIMGRLNISDRIFLGKLLKSILDRNFKDVAQLHLDKGMIPSSTSINGFAQAIRSVSTPILDKKLGQISLGNLLGQLFGMANRWQITIQPQFLILQKTMVMAEGVGRQMNPETDMWKMARPMVENWLNSQSFKNEMIKEYINNFKLITNQLPVILEKINSNDFKKAPVKKRVLPLYLFIILILLGIFVYYNV